MARLISRRAAARVVDTLTAGDFSLPACAPTDPDPAPAASECVRFPEDAQTDRPYTVAGTDAVSTTAPLAK